LVNGNKRRQTYGVIICDAKTSKPIDLLQDRNVETLKTWLENYIPITFEKSLRYLPVFFALFLVRQSEIVD